MLEMVKGVMWVSLLELSKYSSKHYDFYFSIDSVAEKDILKSQKIKKIVIKKYVIF